MPTMRLDGESAATAAVTAPVPEPTSRTESLSRRPPNCTKGNASARLHRPMNRSYESPAENIPQSRFLRLVVEADPIAELGSRMRGCNVEQCDRPEQRPRLGRGDGEGDLRLRLDRRLVTGNPCFGSPVGIRVGNRDSRGGHTLITSQPRNVGGIREHERPQPQTWCGECGLFHRRYPVRLSLIIEAKSRVLDHTT